MEEFLHKLNYPFNNLWTLPFLQRHAFCLRAVRQRKIVGYTWFSTVPDCYRMLQLHFAFAPTVQRRWFSRGVKDQLHSIASFLDADTVIIVYNNHDQMAGLVKHGFKVMPPFALYDMRSNE